MSLLDEERPVNPTRHFIKVKNGALSYYDKEIGEDVAVATPLRFVVLDTLSTVRGWSIEDDTAYWSNEVRAISRDPLVVRTGNGIKASGLWKDIKDELKSDGAKYYSSIYIAAKGKNGLEIQNLSLKGAAVNAWIEFAKKANLKKNAVILSSWEEQGKAIKYKVPVFQAVEMDKKEYDEAVALAKELKEYHNQYFSFTSNVESDKVQDEVVEAFDDDEPVDLSSIPF